MTGVAFHPTKNLVASCSYDKSVKLWNADTGAELWTVNVDSAVRSVRFSPAGDIVAAGCDDGTVQLIDVATAEVKRPLRGHSHWVLSVAWSPDGTKLASGSQDQTVRIWEAATGKQLWQLNVDGHVWSIDFAPCGNKFAIACNNYNSSSYSVQIFSQEGSTGNFVCQSTLNVGSRVWSVSFSPAGDIVAAGCHDGTVQLIDVATAEATPEGAQVRPFPFQRMLSIFWLVLTCCV